MVFIFSTPLNFGFDNNCKTRMVIHHSDQEPCHFNSNVSLAAFRVSVLRTVSQETPNGFTNIYRMKDLRMDKTMVTDSMKRAFLLLKYLFCYKRTKFIVMRINSILLYTQLLKIHRLH